jgi:hypothetical protein
VVGAQVPLEQESEALGGLAYDQDR